MTDLSALHDDEIVAEMQRRLDRGSVGWHGLLSAHQRSFRDIWCALYGYLNDRCNRTGDPGALSEAWIIRDRMHLLINEGSDEIKIFAVNTTYLGRSAFEDHSPRRDAA